VPGLTSLFGTGLGLAAGAGLNAYAVLLVYGGLARLFPDEFPGGIARFLSTTPALASFGVLFLLEFFADKIPGLDHVWDLLHSVVRPLAGVVLSLAAVEPGTDSIALQVLAGGSGGVVSLLSHLLKAATRVTSTALTAGVANAALSLAEDIVAFLQALVSIFLPLVALAIVAGLGILFLLTVPRLARTTNLLGRHRPPRPSPPAR
jgi:hypothetical protein